MSNTIHPYSSSRAHLQQRAEPTTDSEDDSLTLEQGKADKASKSQSAPGDAQAKKPDALEKSELTQLSTVNRLHEAEESAANPFINTLEGAIDRKDDAAIRPDNSLDISSLPGLTVDEQQMIFRYFPKSPSLELRLYKPDMSTNKVDPGSVGSRVDIRG